MVASTNNKCPTNACHKDVPPCLVDVGGVSAGQIPSQFNYMCANTNNNNCVCNVIGCYD